MWDPGNPRHPRVRGTQRGRTPQGTTEWHTPQGLSEPGFESGPRVEVILAILLMPLILKLVTRLPHVGRSHANRPNPGNRPTEDDIASLASTRNRRHCLLTSPTMLFIPPQWFIAGPESEQCLRNVLKYCGHEFAAQQWADYTCNTFVSLMFPKQGDVLPSEHPHQADPVELAAMIGCRSHYRIIRTPWTGSWALMTYGNHRVFVPASCRRPLIQAAHAAMHEGMGTTGYLLKKAFYWPTLTEDARQFTQACHAIRTKRTQRIGQGPPAPPRSGDMEPTAEPNPRPAARRKGNRGPRPSLRSPTTRAPGEPAVEVDPTVEVNLRCPHGHVWGDQPTRENGARCAENELQLEGDPDEAKAKTGPAQADPFDPLLDKA